MMELMDIVPKKPTDFQYSIEILGDLWLVRASFPADEFQYSIEILIPSEIMLASAHVGLFQYSIEIFQGDVLDNWRRCAVSQFQYPIEIFARWLSATPHIRGGVSIFYWNLQSIVRTLIRCGRDYWFQYSIEILTMYALRMYLKDYIEFQYSIEILLEIQ